MKILFICSNLIGDTILSSGVIKHFIDQNKDAKLSFVIGPTAAPLLKNFKNVENLIIFQKRKFNLHWIDILKKTYGVKWDIIIDFRSSVVSYFLNNKKKYIFTKKKGLHHIQQLNSCFGFNCSNLFIPTSLDEEKKANISLDSNFRHIVIFPGGNWKPKLWSIENYNFVMSSLLLKYNNLKFILVGSYEEKEEYYNKLVKNINSNYIIDLFGLDLTSTSAFMKKSDFFIGNDSGLMHLAVANKLKVVSLFGPTNDLVYGPYGSENIIIRTSESLDYFKTINIDKNKSYMNSINPDIIIESCENILNEKIN